MITELLRSMYVSLFQVRLRSILGRFFNSNNNEVNSSSSSYYSGPGEISSPYNTVHRIHVGYDGKKFTGLPQPWMDTLLRDIRSVLDFSWNIQNYLIVSNRLEYSSYTNVSSRINIVIHLQWSRPEEESFSSCFSTEILCKNCYGTGSR